MAKKKTEERVVYIGNGAYRIGVPARDLTMDEWEDLPEEEREACLRLGLYQLDAGPGGARPAERGTSSPPDEPDWPLVLTDDEDEDAEGVEESEQ